MTKSKWFALAEALLLCCVVTVFADNLEADIPPVPTPGLVTMVDLGAHKCIPCKMMEKIIKNNIVAYMDSNKLFSDAQFGFRSLRSCALQLLEQMEQ